MRLKCECGWEGEIWDASISLMRVGTTVISCPDCKCGVSIGTRIETTVEYVLHDADGTRRHPDIPEEADPLDIWTKEGLANLNATIGRVFPDETVS